MVTCCYPEPSHSSSPSLSFLSSKVRRVSDRCPSLSFKGWSDSSCRIVDVGDSMKCCCADAVHLLGSLVAVVLERSSGAEECCQRRRSNKRAAFKRLKTTAVALLGG